MKKTIFTGSAVAIVTPFTKDNKINFNKLGELIEFQIKNGTDCIVACGTTSESPTLSHEEHCAVIKFAIDTVSGRVPVVAGTGSNDTSYALKLSLEAQEMGADALLMVTPYYNKASQRSIIKHFNYIADKVNTPIIVYNVPSRTGFNILPETYAELAKHQNIAAIKEANGDISSVVKTISLCGDLVDVYSGNDDQIVAMMSLGAKGVISVASNIMPAETHDMATLALGGNFKEAAKLQLDLLDIFNALFMDVNPVPVKEAMNLMGMDVGSCRLPLCDMEENKINALKNIMKKHNLI